MKSCLKISYHGEDSFIICEAGTNYDQIIAQASARFRVDKTQRVGLVLTNGQGYVFEPQILEYFLQLFPCPELMFYLRMDWQKLRRALIEPIKRRRSADDIHDIKQQESETDYEAVPVHRQNCFIGALPDTSTACAASVHRRRQTSLSLSSSSLVLRRLKERKQSPLKRLLRPLCNTSRRSVPPAKPHVNLLATNSRSIRI